jgi:aspartyl-tRNA(Asn)/glutamyl-tRNA(Gln) amidotransferase subunit A
MEKKSTIGTTKHIQNNMNDILHWDLCTAVDAIKDKKISSYELTQWSLQRLKQIGGTLNAVFRLDEESALKRAHVLDDLQAHHRPLGMLHGVPFAHKDLILMAGRSAHIGSKILKKNIPEKNAVVMDYFESAGQVYCGSLHMTEFALGPTGFNRHYGHAKNPWNEKMVCGGSSSGSAIAVSARLVFGAIGSDTGGSIRHPATMCGVTGLKPTSTLVNIEGTFPLAHTLDCIGPLAQSARDCAKMLTVLTHQDKNYELSLSSSVAGFKVGIPQHYFWEGLDTNIQDVLLENIPVFKALGMQMVEIDNPLMQPINDMMAVVMAVEALEVHHEWLKQRSEDYADQVRARIELGYQYSDEDYRKALNMRKFYRQQFDEKVFGTCDVLFIPTIQVHTPSIEASTRGSLEEVLKGVRRLTHVTKAMNYLGYPSISVPGGFSDQGMPVGFQLVGRDLSEDRLLRIAHAYQTQTDWHRRLPSTAFTKEAI